MSTAFAISQLQEVEEEGLGDQEVRSRESFGLMMDIEGDINTSPGICPSLLDSSSLHSLGPDTLEPLEGYYTANLENNINLENTANLENLDVRRSTRLKRARDSSDEDYHPRRGVNEKWSEEQVKALIEGYEEHGSCWSRIQKPRPEIFMNKNRIDLKDKFRNLCGTRRSAKLAKKGASS